MSSSVPSELLPLRSLLEQGRLDEALEHAHQAVAAWPGDAWAWHLLAVAQHRKRDLPSAEGAALQAVQLSEGEALHRLLLASIYGETGQLVEAGAALDRAIELRREWGLIWHRRGEVRFQQNRFDESAADFATAAQLMPHCAEAHHNSAIAWAAARRWPECEKVLVGCIAADPERAAAWCALLVQAGRLQAIDETYSHVHRIKNLVGVLNQRLQRVLRRIGPGLEAIDGRRLERLLHAHEGAYQDVVAILKAIAVQPLAFDWTDLGELVRACLIAASASIGSRHVVTYLEQGAPKILCDAARVQEALLNVIVNGCEATAADDVISVSSWRAGDQVSIAVADTGLGIPEDSIPEIYRMGYTTKPYGTGFGLAYVKQVVDKHQGSIRVQSVEGQGSVLTIQLPIRPQLSEDLTNFQLRPLPGDTLGAILEREQGSGP